MKRAGLALFLALGLTAQTPSADPDDPGRPKLKRGGPATRKAPAEARPEVKTTGGVPPETAGAEKAIDAEGRPVLAAPTSLPPSTSTASAPPEDLIERARITAYEFGATLPNFICDQLTMRSTSGTKVADWRMRDRVEVELLYVDGKEDYRNIRINGKALKKGSPEDSGTWSTGEFGTTLLDIFSSTTNAKFTKKVASSASGMDAIVYDYTVEQPNSHWEIRYGRTVKPAYKGSLWIDPRSARVLRIEMQARNLPADYEMDTIELVVDYNFVTIAGQKYLMPYKSENLACFRGTFNCTKNEIQFRNYRKFGAESTISTTDSAVSFEGAASPPPPPPVEQKKPKKKK